MVIGKAGSALVRLLASGAMAAALLLPGTAFAGWREELGTFRIGIAAQPGAGETVQGVSRIKDAFSQVLAMPVEVFVARDLAALIEAQAASRVESAVYPVTAYAVAQRLCECVEPIVAPVGADGSTGLRAVLVGRAGKATALDKLAGIRIAVPPSDAVAGNLLAMGGLAAASINLPESGATIVEASGSSSAEAMFVDGSVDALIGWEPALPGAEDPPGGTRARLVAAGIDPATLVTLWRSEPLRYGPHALRTGLDPEVRRLLVPFLTGMLDVMPDVYELLETQHGGGFRPVTQDDYASAIDMIDHATRAGVHN